ncbi:MAG: type II toxin-antitoxin system Phd/YefM family antitoxin [Lachnospiraceae bacterium]|nr:type II toxin-antitoxin system Phd/YefM family antitoxin [Lachnospiraceae bacterium]
MQNVVSAIKNTVSVSQFNKGMAGKIFSAVKGGDVKVVMKNNTPECVLMSPDEYVRMMDELEDARVMMLALDRLKNDDPSKGVSRDAIMSKYGITQEMLDEIEDVELG